jgi:hypothetical protein
LNAGWNIDAFTELDTAYINVVEWMQIASKKRVRLWRPPWGYRDR